MGANALKGLPPGIGGMNGGTMGTMGTMGDGMGSTVPPLQAQPAVPPLGGAIPLQPLTHKTGRVLRKGQAAIPVGQNPINPWGQNRGGSGLLPLYRRPRTMPGTTKS